MMKRYQLPLGAASSQVRSDGSGPAVASGFSRTARIKTCSIEGVYPGRPERLKTFDYLGLHRYSLRFCTDHRQHLFTSAPVVALVLAQFSRAAVEEQFAIIAYCFMPDHVHLLIEGSSETSDCKRFIARSKQYSGYYYSRQFYGILWQRYGFEHVLRNEELTLVVAMYILENPVRAGPVQQVQEYPFVGSLVYDLTDLLESIRLSPPKGGHHLPRSG